MIVNILNIVKRYIQKNNYLYREKQKQKAILNTGNLCLLLSN